MWDAVNSIFGQDLIFAWCGYISDTFGSSKHPGINIAIPKIKQFNSIILIKMCYASLSNTSKQEDTSRSGHVKFALRGETVTLISCVSCAKKLQRWETEVVGHCSRLSDKWWWMCRQATLLQEGSTSDILTRGRQPWSFSANVQHPTWWLTIFLRSGVVPQRPGRIKKSAGYQHFKIYIYIRSLMFIMCTW